MKLPAVLVVFLPPLPAVNPTNAEPTREALTLFFPLEPEANAFFFAKGKTLGSMVLNFVSSAIWMILMNRDDFETRSACICIHVYRPRTRVKS